MLEPVVLEGEYVRLEPLAAGHAEGLWQAARHAELWTWMPFRVESEENARDLIAFAASAAAAGTALSFAQIWQETGQVIGSSSYLAPDARNRRVEIGATWVTPAFQRSAANTETKLLLMGHAFDTLGCHRVEFKTDAKNQKSRAALARLGAREEGTLRSHMVRPDGSLRDSVYFSVIAREWPGVRAHLQKRLAQG